MNNLPPHLNGIPLSVIKEHIISVPASTEHLSRVRKFVADLAHNTGFSDSDIEDIRLAVDEACTNVIKHAYKSDSTKTIQVKVGQNRNGLIISLLDTGDRFDPGSCSGLNLKERVRRRKRGGMGLTLIRKFMDKVEYRHRGSVNEIRMTKEKP
ncbi:MAG: ATP-binding protein [Balneolales bacterium]